MIHSTRIRGRIRSVAVPWRQLRRRRDAGEWSSPRTCRRRSLRSRQGDSDVAGWWRSHVSDGAENEAIRVAKFAIGSVGDCQSFLAVTCLQLHVKTLSSQAILAQRVLLKYRDLTKRKLCCPPPVQRRGLKCFNLHRPASCSPHLPPRKASTSQLLSLCLPAWPSSATQQLSRICSHYADHPSRCPRLKSFQVMPLLSRHVR